MKKFDLQAALAGAPVITQSGLKVTITKLTVACKNGMALLSQNSEGDIVAYHHADGTPQYNEMYNLFMAPVEKTVWVNLYPNCTMSGIHADDPFTCWHSTEEAADIGAGTTSRLGNKAHKITYTE